MTHIDIIKKVRDILNEHGGDNELSITTDRVLLDEYIESAIPDAVVMLASKGYIVNIKELVFGGSDGVDIDNFSVDDFISLIRAKSVDWNKEVTRLTPHDSAEFAMAQNRFTKPGPNNPIVFWKGPEEFDFGFLPNTKVVDGKTVAIKVKMFYNAAYKVPEDANEDALKANPKEATAVCYMTAALVMGMFEDDLGKQRLSDISTNMLQ